MGKIRITAPAPDHAQIGNVGTDDHHAIQHAIDSALVHSGIITDAQHGVRNTANPHEHSQLELIGVDDHHAQTHNIASHSDGSGVGTEATQAQIEAETAGLTFVPPDLLKNSPGVAKGWCQITAAGLLSAPDYNVASVTGVTTGNRTVVWDTDFSGTVYAAFATANAAANEALMFICSSPAVGSISHTIRNTVPANVDLATSVVALGDQ